MNIIYLHSHDTGRYLQPYGHAVPAPNLQRLAEEGVLFRKAFNAAPTCSPSRACLLTGQNAHGCGQLGLANRDFFLQHPERHLANFLRGHGYRTALCGFQHLVLDTRTLGYEWIAEVNPPGSGSARGTTAAAVDFINQAHDRPFFLAVGYFETHREFPEPTEEEDERYTLPPAPLPDTPQTRYDMASYKRMAKILDDQVGAVLEALEQAGLAEDTLFIYTTDHGLAFPAMKCTLTDHGMGVALIVRGPHGFGGGKVVDGMISQIDIYPTLCELLGVEPPEWLEGRSVLPLVAGTADEINEEIFAEVTYHAAYEPKRAVRTQRWKYIRRFDRWPTTALPNIDDGPSKQYLLENGLAGRTVHQEALYDLVYDPNEACNLVNDPAYAEPLAEMRRRLWSWMERTDDPLLRGPVPAAEGSYVDSADETDPDAERAAVLLWRDRERLDMRQG
ncbi:MAG: sulfatase [Caldilineaceae bacterium]|nr:sulfatase [Caldilineaceae bacterium]